MKLEQQVVSKELAQKMKDLGFKQESFFDWECRMSNWSLIWGDYHVHPYIDTADVRQYVSAYTVAELGEILKNYSGDLPSWDNTQWECFVDLKDGSFRSKDADTEADCRAKLLILLAEHSLINPTELK